MIDPDRVAEILIDLPDGSQRRGSGYRVTTESVLTAAHVITGAARVRVRFNADRPEAWTASAGPIVVAAEGDVAVLMIDPDGGPSIESAGFGRLGDRDAVLECRLLGFPRFKLRKNLLQQQLGVQEQYRDTAHIVGSVGVLSNRREGTLEISIATPPAADRDPRHSPWEGMSGAAVFMRGRIVGLISEHHAGDGLGRLAAVRVDSWYEALDPDHLGPLAAAIGLPATREALPDIVPTSVPAAEAAYVAQLRDIVPTQLVEREQELEDLVNWCAKPGGYLWWQAPPWAGKTALMASFALHPPAGTVVASFFITSRLAGQADSDAFLLAMIDQLSAIAELTAVPAPGQVARRGQFLHLLEAAEGRASERGQRLVLVVDGLDEDRSLHGSIASLLPRHPPGNAHVLVASRPHPGIPADVPGDHPLRSCTVRFLQPSSFARDMQIEAISELKEQLKFGTHGVEILALITASGGGLTQQDLHELSGRPSWELDDQLGSVFGRSLQTRIREGRDHTYLFAHETLRVIAETTLSDDLGQYRDRIHAWAEGYQGRGWPTDTPGYLLWPYGRMLIEQDDLRRIGLVATSRARHEVMGQRTGTDAAALSEILTVWQKLEGLASPDLQVITLLAVERSRLENRNTVIPARLPEALALVGEVDRAEALAQLITSPYRYVQALIGVAHAIADADPARAERIAESILDPGRLVEALAAVIPVRLARDPRAGAELTERLVKTAGENTDPARQAEALARIVEAVGKVQPETAIRLAGETLPIAQAVTDPSLRIKLLTLIARAASGFDSALTARLADQTLEMTADIADTHDRWDTLSAVAEVMALVDPGRATRVVTADSDKTRSAQSLATVARAMASIDPDGAEQLARTISIRRWQVLALIEVARRRPAAPDGLIAEVLEMVRRIHEPSYRAQALTAAAAATAEVDPGQARHIAEQAAETARMIAALPARADALTAVAIAVNGSDRAYSFQLIEETARLADAITGGQRRLQAFTAVLAVVTETSPGNVASLAKAGFDTAQEIADIRMLAEAALAAGSSLPKALETARKISDLGLRDRAATIIALAMVRTDADGALRIVNRAGAYSAAQARHEVALRIAKRDPEKALSIADGMRDFEPERTDLMAAALLSLAELDPDRAEELAIRSVPFGTDPVQLGRLAQAVALANPAKAARLSIKATELAHTLEAFTRHQELSAILLGVIACSDPDRAERIARQVGKPEKQAMSWSEIARMVARSDPERALRMAMEIDQRHLQAEVLAEIAIQANRLGTARRPAALRALVLLLSGSQWTDAFWPLAVIDPDAAQAGCEALVSEPAFYVPGVSAAVDRSRHN